MAKMKALVVFQVTDKNRCKHSLSREDIGKWAFLLPGGGTFVTDTYSDAIAAANSMR